MINGKKYYLFTMLDRKTRFWLSSHIAKKKNQRHVNKLFKKVKEIAGKTPSVLITDGAGCYAASFEEVFAKEKTGKSSIHVSEIHLASQHVHTNGIESFNGTIRGNTKKISGLKKVFYFVGLRIYYNYIRPHSGLNGDTPADRAGIIVEGPNKWNTLILNAMKDSHNIKFVE